MTAISTTPSKIITLKAGQDFAIVGFDDISQAALWQPALTTVGLE